MKKLLIFLASILAFFSCAKDNFDIVDPMIFEGTICIHVGETHFVETSPVRDITWTSSDETVASATNGYLLGKSVGNCTVTAKYGSCKRAFEVIVVATEVKYYEMPSKLTVVPGYSNSFEISNCDPSYATAASITWAFASIFPYNEHFSFSVSDRTVTVFADESTPLNAKAKLIGYGYHAQGEEYLRDIEIEVGEYSISLSSYSLNLEAGDSRELKATVSPTSPNISWESSNPDVATYSNGLVTAHSAGSATITASIDGKYKAKCEVNVRAKRVVPDDYKICLYESSQPLEGYAYDQLSNRITSIDIVPGGNLQRFYVGTEDGYTLTKSDLEKISGEGNGRISITLSGDFHPNVLNEYPSGFLPDYCLYDGCNVSMLPEMKSASISMKAPNGSTATLSINPRIGSISVMDIRGDDRILGTAPVGGTITVSRKGYPKIEFQLNVYDYYFKNTSYNVLGKDKYHFMMTHPSVFKEDGSMYWFELSSIPTGTYEFHILDEPTGGEEIDLPIYLKITD